MRALHTPSEGDAGGQQDAAAAAASAALGALPNLSTDWVAAGYAASVWELRARRLLAHAPSHPPGSLQVVGVDGGVSPPSPLPVEAEAALERVVALLTAARSGRAEWLKQGGCGGVDGPPPATPTEGESVGVGAAVDDPAVASCLQRIGLEGARGYPPALYAGPHTALLRSLGGALRWLGRHADADAVFLAGATPGLDGVGWVVGGGRPLLPLALRHGGCVPFWDGSAATDCFHALLRHAESGLAPVIAEAAALLPTWPLKREGAGLGDGGWSQLVLGVNGVARPAGCESAPAACAWLQSLSPLVHVADGQAKMSVIAPGSSVRPHSGPTVARLRMHCCLIQPTSGPVFIVGGVSRRWVPGQCFLFDESMEHEVRGVSGGGGPRVVLLVDIANPLLARRTDFLGALAPHASVKEALAEWETVQRECAA